MINFVVPVSWDKGISGTPCYGPAFPTLYTSAADCYKTIARVSLADNIYRVPLVAPFQVGWVKDTSQSFDFEKSPDLNAFCALRAEKPIPVGVISLFLPKLDSDKYGPGTPAEPNLAKKKQDFCDATRGPASHSE